MALCGFIKGVIAGNHDNEYVYIDGVMRIAGKPANELAHFSICSTRSRRKIAHHHRFHFCGKGRTS
ncbi:MAG: hypothetical protein ACLRSW_17905 [Christensenellaceae bacterium]